MEKRVSEFNKIGLQKNLFNNLIYCDVTMRDGEQTPGVSFSIEEKIKIAKKLDHMGINQLQIGIIGAADNEEMKQLCDLNLTCDMEIMTKGTDKNWQSDIMNAIECGSDIIHTFLPTSTYIRGMYADLNDESLLKHAEVIVNYMKKNSNKKINVSLLDATRTDIKFLSKMVALLSKLGVDRIRIADTVGTATPEGIYYLINKVREITTKENKETIIGIHCHNDFGLATANVFAAVKAGASLIDVSVNGLGDRSGNPSLAEVLVGMNVLYGEETSFNYKEIRGLSLMVEKLSGIQIPSNKPLVGKYAFADEFDGHIAALLKDPFAFQAIAPEAIGNKREVVVGKNSGHISLRFKYKQLGINLTDEQCDSLLSEVKLLNESNKGKIISDEDLIGIYRRIL